ncbi:hypothetical protein [Actinospica robiniae]|uniref:hypothetical protein n=1 Tax=Actinospica robiniae TaxID=304901 RepID=UPI00040B5D87|nr:hypothetical protein [Actinospica robiniae]
MTRVLIAPVTVSPTKALTPSHIKGLLWVDVMRRATALVAEVDYHYSITTSSTTRQTLGFWEYLDRTFGDLDYAAYGEEQLGELYIRYQAEPGRVPFAALKPYLRAVEESGWVHPASARLLRLWTGYYAQLGMHDPGLTRIQPPGIDLPELLDTLAGQYLCLDGRNHGGPVYLDGTRYGLPLRQIVSPEGQPNYLAGTLRELVPSAARYEEIVLVHDRELTEDYVLLQRVLGALGANAVRVSLDRVPIDGVVKASRHGGWQGHTLPAMLAACDGSGAEALKLGMRMHFIAVLGKGSSESFRAEVLRRTVDRAGRLLAATEYDAAPSGAELAKYVGRYTGAKQHVDPYRLTAEMLTRHRNPPVRDLIEQVYC